MTQLKPECIVPDSERVTFSISPSTREACDGLARSMGASCDILHHLAQRKSPHTSSKLKGRDEFSSSWTILTDFLSDREALPISVRRPKVMLLSDKDNCHEIDILSHILTIHNHPAQQLNPDLVLGTLDLLLVEWVRKKRMQEQTLLTRIARSRCI